MPVNKINGVLLIRILLLVSFILPGYKSKSQIDSYIGPYTGANKDGYLQPVASVLTSAFNVGQVMHTRIDSSFRVYFHIIGTASFILSDKLKYFNAVTPDGFLPAQSVSAPTLLGPRESKTVAGINGRHILFQRVWVWNFYPWLFRSLLWLMEELN